MPTMEEVQDSLETKKDSWLEKYRGLIVQDEPPPELDGLAKFFGGRDEKLTDAPLGWGHGTALRGAPSLTGLRTTMAEKYREGEGVIDLVENEDGHRMVAKIDRSASFGNSGEELAVYQHIYETVGPHPNLATVHGLAVVQHGMGKMPALIMDEVVGDPGDEAMRKLQNALKRGDITTEEFWGSIQFLGRRLLEVVAHLQDAGIAHNDIKPGNFVIDAKTGEPVLIDLGLHSALGDYAGGGTEGTSAPQIMGRGKSTDTTDVYSVGASILKGLKGMTVDGVETDLTRALAGMMLGRSGGLAPDEGALLSFFQDSPIDDERARQVLARVVSTDDPPPRERVITVTDEEARKLGVAWRRIEGMGHASELIGARARRRLEWLGEAETLLARAKDEGVTSKGFDDLRQHVGRCTRELEVSSSKHQDPPEPVKWTPEWAPVLINDYTRNVMAGAVQRLIDDAGDLLADEPHLSTINLVLSLQERAQALVKSLRAYINALTPPILPSKKKLAKLHKQALKAEKKRAKGKKKVKAVVEPPWDKLGDMETARLVFVEQFELLEPVERALRQRASTLVGMMSNAGPDVDELLTGAWYPGVKGAVETFEATKPVVYASLDDEKRRKVQEFLDAARVAWRTIGPQEAALRTWLGAAVKASGLLGRGALPDEGLVEKRGRLHEWISVVSRAVSIERDWIARPGGQPAPLPTLDITPEPPEHIGLILDLREKIEEASINPDLSLSARADALNELEDVLDSWDEVVDDEAGIKALKNARRLWQRCAKRLEGRYDTTLKEAHAFVKETTPDHIWRTMNSIEVHMEHPDELERPPLRWFERELAAVARLVNKAARLLALLGDMVDSETEAKLEELAKTPDGYAKLAKRFELMARTDLAKPPPPRRAPPSRLWASIDDLIRRIEGAAAAPWPRVVDAREKIRKRIEELEGLGDDVDELKDDVDESDDERDAEHFALAKRVQSGLVGALRARL